MSALGEFTFPRAHFAWLRRAVSLSRKIREAAPKGLSPILFAQVGLLDFLVGHEFLARP
jgi:hypothetical protein